MKNISLILNIVLIIAVTLLYIDKFTGNSGNEDVNTETSGGGGDVVYINLDSLIVEASKLISLDNLKVRLDKAEGISDTKVLFVSDCFVKEMDHSEESNLRDLLTLFDSNVANLLSKMISAMGIPQSEYRVSAISYLEDENEHSYFEFLKSEILLFEPTLIITLGAKATNELLQLKSRLKDIHGQFYKLNLKIRKVQIT